MSGPGARASPASVLFACVHNAGRSQMAAALFDSAADPARARATSAGTQPAAAVHPEVVAAMRELGIDLAGARPRRLTPELAREASLLVTMGCGEECPAAPGLERVDWPLRDPRGEGPELVRAIRDEIRARVAALLAGRGWGRAPPLAAGARLRPARAAEAAALSALLRSAGLSDDGLAEGLDDYVVCERAGRIVGLAGLERHGDAGLLRSVAVSSDARRDGIGAALVAERLARAREGGLGAVHLLTRDAAGFFARLGFVAAPRGEAPEAVRRSSQFAGESCTGATAMVLRLR